MHDYFKYLPRPEGPLAWGAAVTSSGLAHIPPGGAYPPSDFHHPQDHIFTWARGRVLDVWQVILIHEGEGWFESEPTGRQACRAGSVFILFPGVWHRYKPAATTGWTDSYIEFAGPAPDQLRRQGILLPRQAVFHLGVQPELADLFMRAHELMQTEPMGYPALLATTLLQILSLVLSLSHGVDSAPRRAHEIVRRAQGLLAARSDQPLQIACLARELGIGYSYFRRIFHRFTGLSPKQYAGQLRLRRVQSLLRNTSLTIKEIAEQLHYNSPYHLSAEFKRHTRLSPTRWRQQQGEAAHARATRLGDDPG